MGSEEIGASNRIPPWSSHGNNSHGTGHPRHTLPWARRGAPRNLNEMRHQPATQSCVSACGNYWNVNVLRRKVRLLCQPGLKSSGPFLMPSMEKSTVGVVFGSGTMYSGLGVKGCAPAYSGRP